MDDAAGSAGDGGPDESAPRPLRVACLLIGLEALALVGLAVLLLAKTVGGHPASLGRALAGAALALAGGVALGLAARALLRLRPGARTPVVVLQLLALPVSYSLAFEAHRVGYGGPILIVALAVLYLLFTPPSRAALDREPPR